LLSFWISLGSASAISQSTIATRAGIDPEKMHTPTAETPPAAGIFAVASMQNRCFFEPILKKQVPCQKKSHPDGRQVH
jgi:hypothetical protein